MTPTASQILRFGPIRRVAAGWLVAALVLVLAASQAGPAPSPGSAATLAMAGRSGSASGRSSAPSGPLPDSVLARIGANREISVATFRRAWAQVQDPQHPDTLTPDAARRFLDLMIDKEALSALALASRAPWKRGDSLAVLSYRDQLMMKAVLDSALVETARRRNAAGEPELNRMDLGVAARENAMSALHVSYDAELTARLAGLWKVLPVPPSDSSMSAQYRMRAAMPAVPSADTTRAVAHSDIGDYLVSELLAQWRWIDPWSRPHIDTAAAIEELARNGLFERLLRRQATERQLDRRPELAQLIERRREYVAATVYVSREVYGKIRPDSAAQMRWYRGHVADYRLPDRAVIARWVLPDQAGAGRLAAMLRDPVSAESLIAQGRRNGANFLDEITAAGDSTLFRDAQRLGAGSVVGPDSIPGGWRVVRVQSLEPARPRLFPEAQPLVVQAMTDSLGELGMRDLVRRVRRETPTRINQPALERLTARR